MLAAFDLVGLAFGPVTAVENGTLEIDSRSIIRLPGMPGGTPADAASS